MAEGFSGLEMLPPIRVRIVDGPFAGFESSVEAIDVAGGRVTVRVPFFGKRVPVELDFEQLQRL
jgi:transcriptional antiterminator NusG